MRQLRLSRRRGLSLPSCQPDCSLISSRMCCLSCLGRGLSLQICHRTQTVGRAIHQSPCVIWAGRSNLPATMYVGLKYDLQGCNMQKQHKSMLGKCVAISKTMIHISCNKGSLMIHNSVHHLIFWSYFCHSCICPLTCNQMFLAASLVFLGPTTADFCQSHDIDECRDI